MYSYSSEKVIKDLINHGFSKLPSIRSIVQKNNYFEIYKSESVTKTYKENSLAHLKLIEDMDLKKLFKALYNHGKDLNLSINEKDHYFISRFVRNGQTNEGFKGHFDSHFITIVLPVFIPQNKKQYNCGELLAAPKFRGNTSSEIINILQKVYTKKFNSKEKFIELIRKGKAITFNFNDYKPLIFYGNRTFHGNFPLIGSTSDRLTFLCHLYDTSPPYGIGTILRKIRRR